MMSAINAIGQRLQLLRNKMGLSQHALAEKSGVSFRSIQDIEGRKGNPTVSTLVDLSQTLKAPLVLFDVDNYISRKEHDRIASMLANDYQKKCDELAAVTRKNFSLQDKYFEALEEIKKLRSLIGPFEAVLMALKDAKPLVLKSICDQLGVPVPAPKRVQGARGQT